MAPALSKNSHITIHHRDFTTAVFDTPAPSIPAKPDYRRNNFASVARNHYPDCRAIR
jgi:hypothetical protein